MWINQLSQQKLELEMGLYMQKHCQLGLKEQRQDQGRLWYWWDSTGWTTRAIQLQTRVILQQKGRETLKPIQRQQGCHGHHRHRALGCLRLSSRRSDHLLGYSRPGCCLPGSWEGRTAPSEGPEDKTSTQRGLFLSLKVYNLMEFVWLGFASACNPPLFSSFQFLPFQMEYHPVPVTALYLEAHHLSAFPGSQLEGNFASG